MEARAAFHERQNPHTNSPVFVSAHAPSGNPLCGDNVSNPCRTLAEALAVAVSHRNHGRIIFLPGIYNAHWKDSASWQMGNCNLNTAYLQLMAAKNNNSGWTLKSVSAVTPGTVLINCSASPDSPSPNPTHLTPGKSIAWHFLSTEVAISGLNFTATGMHDLRKTGQARLRQLRV
jgi:hypothetical protein